MVQADERFLIELRAEGNLDQAFRRVGEEAKRSSDTVQRESREAGTSYKRFSDQVERESKTSVFNLRTVATAVTGIGLAVAGLSLVRTTISTAIGLSEAASDADELQSRFDTLFRGVEGANPAVSQLADALGRSDGAIQQAASGFGSLFVNLGSSREEAFELSLVLSTLSQDLASFFNTSDEEAFAAIRAGLTGETEQLKRFDVFLNDAAIRLRAVELGLADSTKEVDAQARAFAALTLVVEGTREAQGDLIRTQDSFANQTRAIASQIEGLRVTAGRTINEAVQQGIEDAGGVDRILQIAEIGLGTVAELSRVAVAGTVEVLEVGLEAVDRVGGAQGIIGVIGAAADFAVVKIQFIGAQVFEAVEPVFEALEIAGELLGTNDTPSLSRQLRQAQALETRLESLQGRLSSLQEELPGLLTEVSVIGAGGITALEDEASRATVERATVVKESIDDLEGRIAEIQRRLGNFDPIVFELLSAEQGLDDVLPDTSEFEGFGTGFATSFATGVEEGELDAVIAEALASVREIAADKGEEAGTEFAEGFGRKSVVTGEGGDIADPFLPLINSIDLYIDKVKEAQDEQVTFEERLERTGESLDRGFARSLAQGGDAIDRFFENALNSLIELAASEALQSVAGGLFGSSAGGLFEGLFGLFAGGGVVASGSKPIDFFAGGGVVPGGSIPLNYYAGGGIVDSPQLFVAGEGSSKEAIVPMPNGAVPVEFTNGPGAGGPSTLVINLNASSLDPRAAANALGEQAETIAAAIQIQLEENQPLRNAVAAAASTL